MLDVITIGRSSVDLYGAQVGGRLRDMRSFNKYIGGSPTNIAAGAARLGLKSGLITRVGDEEMGRFIRNRLADEGVDLRGVITDPDRLTALVLLGIRDERRFPLIFYRENCADMALCEDDIDPAFIADARCVTATGTHLSHPQVEAATLKALRLARAGGARTALDIDYRPNLWGLSGHGDGENRFIASRAVTDKLQSTLGLFDLIVGTEEEFRIAGGEDDTMAALCAVRALTDATLVCKRGPMGASVFAGEMPARLEDGLSGRGFSVEVFNVLGAGDGFMAGLLKGWLTGRDWETSLTYANACGALAVSRHGCAPAYPSWAELEFFLDRGVRRHALRKDAALEQAHWATTRRRGRPDLRVFAFDHRAQLEAMADAAHADHKRIGAFKNLCLDAALSTADAGDGERAGYGVLCDARLGRAALFAAEDTGLWIARPTERPGARPFDTEDDVGPEYGGLSEWPVDHVAKALCMYHPDDDQDMKQRQEAAILRLFRAARRNDLEFLLELIPAKSGAPDLTAVGAAVDRFYQIGVFPDWWKLPPMTDRAEWRALCDLIEGHDPWRPGVVILGLDQPREKLAASFSAAAAFPMVRGFAVGRTIFGRAAQSWLAGEISDAEATRDMAARFGALCDIWDAARKDARRNTEKDARR